MVPVKSHGGGDVESGIYVSLPGMPFPDSSKFVT